jgi:hypothetical protein
VWACGQKYSFTTKLKKSLEFAEEYNKIDILSYKTYNELGII